MKMSRRPLFYFLAGHSNRNFLINEKLRPSLLNTKGSFLFCIFFSRKDNKNGFPNLQKYNWRMEWEIIAMSVRSSPSNSSGTFQVWFHNLKKNFKKKFKEQVIPRSYFTKKIIDYVSNCTTNFTRYLMDFCP